ncbi:MAG: response regulator [Candidatus Omnitrophica bacterium]|nr:response regulator [Candidatus Omnitrophota bacterium]
MSVKILLIEDNPDHVLITKDVLALASKDWQVDSLGDPKQGLKAVIDGDYDLVLCDYRLPGSSALDILKKMKEKGRDLPFIVVTSAGSEKVAVDIMKEGAYDYVVKDETYEEVLPLIVGNALERHNAKKEKERAEKELKIAYAKLKETQEMLIQVEKTEALSRMAAGVAHEVKNPLGIIIQAANYLETVLSQKDTNVFEILGTIKNSVKRADNIINGLVDFSRARELNLKPEEINVILKDSLVLIEYSKNIEIIEELSENLPRALVDKEKMRQVFTNLLLNAAQSMAKRGKLFLRTYVKEIDKLAGKIEKGNRDRFVPGEKVMVTEIEDTGIGIPEEDLRIVFDPFFTTRGPRDGAGLGLTIAKNIIDMHKGVIDIKSRKDEGTTVIVALKI